MFKLEALLEIDQAFTSIVICHDMKHMIVDEPYLCSIASVIAKDFKMLTLRRGSFPICQGEC